MSPILFPAKERMSSSENLLKRSRRLGGMSAASIDLEISRARNTSIPFVFTTSDLVPI